MNDNKIELRSPIINEILTRPPTWIVVWGSSIILFIITTLLIFSYFFKYPDYIDATAIITTEKPPIWLNARNTATISGLFASNFEFVKKGQVIAILENNSNASDVFYIKSPVNGKLIFPNKTNLLQQVKSGDRLFAVIPENPGKLQAYLKFVPSGSGKVKKGQKVRIHIDGYPYMEYGTVSGTINNVSLMPNSENHYTAIAKIPNPLITDYSKKLPFPGELTGVAQIHTEETRLIFRIITPLKYLVMSQKN